MQKLSFNQKRIGAAALLAAALFCTASYLLHFNTFGRFDKQVMISVFVIMFIYQLKIGPSIEEIRDYRQRKATSERPAAFRPLLYISVVALIMLTFFIVGPILQIAKGNSVSQDDWIKVLLTEGLVAIAGFLGWGPTKRLLDSKPRRSGSDS